MAEKTAEYREIPGFPGYRVGDDGSVWSCWSNGGNEHTPRITSKWRELKGWVDKRRGQSTGYVKVGLKRNGRTVHCRVHRLVLEAFVGPCPDGMECRHLDDVKENNALRNLAWGTPTENARDRYVNGINLLGEEHARAKLRASDIPKIRRLLGVLSRRNIAARFGVSKSAIDAIARGRTWKQVA